MWLTALELMFLRAVERGEAAKADGLRRDHGLLYARLVDFGLLRSAAEGWAVTPLGRSAVVRTQHVAEGDGALVIRS